MSVVEGHVTRNQLDEEADKLSQWIEDGKCTIRRPPGPVEDIELSSIVVELIQRLLSIPQEGGLYTSEVTSETYLSAIMLHVHEQLNKIPGSKSVAVFCKLRTQYKPGEDNNGLVTGLLSIVYSTVRQMIKLLPSDIPNSGGNIPVLLRQLDGTLGTYDKALDLIAMLHGEIGNGLMVMLDKLELLGADAGDDMADRMVRYLQNFQRYEGVTKVWCNSNLVEYNYMLQLLHHRNTTRSLGAPKSYPETSIPVSSYRDSGPDSEFKLEGYNFHIRPKSGRSPTKRIEELDISLPLQEPYKIDKKLLDEHRVTSSEQVDVRANQKPSWLFARFARFLNSFRP